MRRDSLRSSPSLLPLSLLLFLFFSVSSYGFDSSAIRLVLIISVDQLRGDYLERFQGVYGSGGLRRFLEQGVVFLDAHHEHANTSTGPGHAVLATGTYPGHSGIVDNQWYEENGKREVYCVGDENSPVLHSGERLRPGMTSAAGRSPKNLLVTALPDWMRKSDPLSKVFSISRKDRAAILMGGKGANGVYWYDDLSGDFVSSGYYLSQLPDWVSLYNQKRIPRSHFGKAWVSATAKKQEGEAGKAQADRGFAHAVGGFGPEPDRSFFTEFGKTPWMDQYLARFAKALIENETVGQDEHVDYFSISFSVLDSVGHEYGPDSAEVLDTIKRLDRVLADLFSFIDEKVGLERSLVVLASDHGVMDLPEFARTKGINAHRIDEKDVLCLQQKGNRFRELYGDDEQWFLSGYHLNNEAIRRKGLSKNRMEEKAAELFAECDYLKKVWTRTQMEKAEAQDNDPHWILFKRSFHPDRSPDLLLQAEKYHVAADGGTSHGSPYRYDTHVPVVFLLPAFRPARISNRVATVDLAPTVARLLGIRTPGTVDGRDLSHYLLYTDQIP